MDKHDLKPRLSGKRIALWVIAGAFIGAGAILPGISGGVLAVVFGIYAPLMETLTHPKDGVKAYWKMLLCVGLGWAGGFLLGGKFVLLLYKLDETVAVSLFVGLIFGTLPSLWREAGKEGRKKGSYLACVLAFLLMGGLLLYVQYGTFATLPPNIFSYAFCGALWGLSLIVPGMSSSSILMALGLYDKMMEGITAFRMSVLLPWLVGMIGVVVLLARVVNYLFQKHYPPAFHAVFGIVVASTVAIIPLQYKNIWEGLLCLAVAVIGFVGGYYSEKLGVNKE